MLSITDSRGGQATIIFVSCVVGLYLAGLVYTTWVRGLADAMQQTPFVPLTATVLIACRLWHGRLTAAIGRKMWHQPGTS